VVKPFTIQAPQKIAEEYGGNKQRIMQAAQMGIVDPTAAVLAGMFIDRMRSAQPQEGAQKPTVAQQVMGSPASPPVSPPSPGGLGSTPQAGPPMAPPQGMADGGMAYAAPYTQGGGLSDVPIPDTMFDEPSNGGFSDGYAGGGLVAFASGGMSDLYDDVQRVETGGDPNAVSPKGARGLMQLMPGTQGNPGFGVAPARDNTSAENVRVGRQYLDAMYNRYGDRATALMAYNWGPGHVDKWIAAGRPSNAVPTETRQYLSKVMGANTALPGAPAASTEQAADTTVPSLADQFPGAIQTAASQYDQLFPATQHTARDKLLEAIGQTSSPEALKKQAHEDKWMTLAQIGFNMAASNSPYLLQAVGAAAAAALPGAQKAKEARQAKSLAALQAYADAEGIDNREALEKRNSIMTLAKDQMGFKNSDLTRATDLKIAQLGNSTKIAAANIRADTAETAATARVAAAEKAAEAKLANAPMEQAVSAARQHIVDSISAGLPIVDPDNPNKKWHAPSGGRAPSAAFIDQLARRIAYKHIMEKQQGRGSAPSAADIILQNTPTGAATTAPNPVDTSAWGQAQRM
jgi:soluble lytic murein transglycosylase-like protein